MNQACFSLQGKGHGTIRLQVRYWPFSMLYSKPREATMVSSRTTGAEHQWAPRNALTQQLKATRPLQGAVLVTLRSAADLPAADNNGLSDPYAKISIGDQKRKSSVQYDTLRPEWNEKYEFIKVTAAALTGVSHYSAAAANAARFCSTRWLCTQTVSGCRWALTRCCASSCSTKTPWTQTTRSALWKSASRRCV